MKVILLYLRILKKFDPTFPEHSSYAESSARFLDTYRKHKPTIPHDLVVVNCGSKEHDGMFDGVAAGYANYNGGGFDCGTFKDVVPTLDCDLCVCCNTHVHFWRDGWLEPFVAAAEENGPGMYGATASYQFWPHLRTPCFAISPKVMAKYPRPCTNRDEACHVESGPCNLSFWAHAHHYPTLLVTQESCYTLNYWRTPRDIFRRGNQSNCLVWDRHTELYARASAEEKAQLERDADTWVSTT